MLTVTKKIPSAKPTPMIIEEKVMKKEGKDQRLSIVLYNFSSTL